MIIQSAQQQSKGQIPLQRHETTWLSLQLVAVTRPSFNAVLPLKAARPQSFSALITRFGHPSSDYYRGWKVRNYINIRLQSSLSRFSFETEQHNYRKYDKKFGAPTTGLRPATIWYIWVHCWLIGAPETNRKNLLTSINSGSVESTRFMVIDAWPWPLTPWPWKPNQFIDIVCICIVPYPCLLSFVLHLHSLNPRTVPGDFWFLSRPLWATSFAATHITEQLRNMSFLLTNLFLCHVRGLMFWSLVRIIQYTLTHAVVLYMFIIND